MGKYTVEGTIQYGGYDIEISEEVESNSEEDAIESIRSNIENNHCVNFSVVDDEDAVEGNYELTGSLEYGGYSIDLTAHEDAYSEADAIDTAVSRVEDNYIVCLTAEAIEEDEE